MTIKLVHTPAGFVSPDDIDHSAAAAPGPGFSVGPEHCVVGTVTRHVEGRFNAGTSESNRTTYVSTPGAGNAAAASSRPSTAPSGNHRCNSSPVMSRAAPWSTTQHAKGDPQERIRQVGGRARSYG